MNFGQVNDILDINKSITNFLKDNPLNLNQNKFKTNKEYFIFDKQVELNYISQVKVTVKHFVKSIINEYFKMLKGDTEDQWNEERQLIFLSPHETFNFQKRYKDKDYKLPLFLIRFRNEPVTKNFRQPLLYKSNSENFMFDTSRITKSFLQEQYISLYENDNPDFNTEDFKKYIFPTLYYDQINQLCNIDFEIVQESQRELSNLFGLMNTKLFQQEKRKMNYQLQIDSFLKTTNDNLKSLQERFYFPLYYIINYTVTWNQYSNQTQIDNNNQWNLQSQMYSFSFEQYPMTRFNLQQSILDIKVDKYFDNNIIEE